jgi:hypothetical protein
MPNLTFIRPELTSCFKLPASLTKVKLHLDGTAAKQRCLFTALDKLPNLERLEIHYGSVIVGFPKLLRCLRWAAIDWRRDWTPLLSAENGIEVLFLKLSDAKVKEDGGNKMWSKLREVRNLRKVEITSAPTSIWAGVASVPRIKELWLNFPKWNLDDAGKKAVSALKDVHVTVVDNRSWWHEADHPEFAFWESLPFVSIEDGH